MVKRLISFDDEAGELGLPDAVENRLRGEFAQVRSGKNLIDSDKTTPGVYIHSSGSLMAAAGFQVTDYIPVKAGVTYTVNYARGLAFYDAALNYIPGTYTTMDDASYTFTPPEDRLFRVTGRTTHLSTWQMEIGDTPTAYEPYQKVLAPVGIPSEYLTPKEGEQRFSRTGNSLKATTTLDGKPLEIEASLTGNSGGIFDWKDVRHDGILITNSADDVAPVVTQQYTIGGNHGFLNAVYWPAENHDKTTADLGSRWEDGDGYEYALLQLRDDGTLLAARKYRIDPDGTKATFWNLPTTPLTHISGATHTAALVSPTDHTEMRPAFQRARHHVTVDGVELHDGEIVTGAEMRIQESYDILDFASIYDLMTANIGIRYEDMTVAAAMRMESDWHIRPNGKIDGDFHLTELQPTRLGRWAGIHAISSSKTPTLWVPGVKPISGLDWSAGVDRSLLTESVYVTADDLHNPAQPPTVRIDVGDDIAVAVGVDPTYGAGTPQARLASIPDQLWYLANNVKIYPRVAGNQGPGWGRVSIRGIRHYLTPGEAAAALAVPTDTTQAWSSLVTKSGKDQHPSDPTVEALSGVQALSGEGFPNGVVTAPVGSIYTDTAATAGAIRWIKTSGTGNTGWEVEWGDTGWRRIGQESVLNGWAFAVVERFYIRRQEDKVHLVIPMYGLTGSTATADGILETPEGFASFTGGNYGVLGFIEEDVSGVLEPVALRKDYNLITTNARGAISGRVTWDTADPWPTTLPGIPA